MEYWFRTLTETPKIINNWRVVCEVLLLKKKTCLSYLFWLETFPLIFKYFLSIRVVWPRRLILFYRHRFVLNFNNWRWNVIRNFETFIIVSTTNRYHRSDKWQRYLVIYSVHLRVRTCRRKRGERPSPHPIWPKGSGLIHV